MISTGIRGGLLRERVCERDGTNCININFLGIIKCLLKRRQNIAELQLVVVFLPTLHHQLVSVRLAVAVPVVHVLRVRAGVGEALQTLAALKRFFT